MPKSFTHFIQQIHFYPEHFLEAHLEALLEKREMTTLKSMELLKRGGDLKEIPCQSCDDDHFLPVRVENEKYYYFCPREDITRNYIDLEDITTWHFDSEAFLQQLSLNLKIEANIEKTKVQDLWHIGGFSKDNTRHNCYYYQGRNFNEVLAFIKKLPSELRRYVIFTTKQELSRLESDHELLLVDLKELVSLKGSRLIFDRKFFDDLLIHGFRSVIFQPKNGDLIVNGKTIANIKPSTAEYYFADLLWKNFNEPISHQRIKRHIYQKMSRDFEDEPQKLAHKQKNKIKKESNKPVLIDEIFKTTKDAEENNAYIMRNPVEA